MSDPTSKYSVARLVPNPIAGEFVNIAIVAWDPGETHVLVKKLTNWSRVEAFSDMPVLSLQTIVDTLSLYSPKAIAQMSIDWQNTIQLTPPRVTFGTAAETLEVMSKNYLVEPNNADKTSDRTDNPGSDLSEGRTYPCPPEERDVFGNCIGGMDLAWWQGDDHNADG